MLPQIHKQALRANQAGNLVYLNNPKVGCSTVKNALWEILAPEAAKGKFDVHSIEGSPFEDKLAKLGWLADANVFTFVRNPFSRLVSAYLNKIVGQEPRKLDQFCQRYQVPADQRLSFDEFVRCISEDAPEYLDPHWRPQHINLMYPFVQPNVIGKLEHMDEELPGVLNRFLAAPLAPVQRKNQHGTNSQKKYRAFFSNPRTLERAVTLYFRDFLHFGYSFDLDAPIEGRPLPDPSDHKHNKFAALAALRRAGTPKDRTQALDQIESLTADDPLTRQDEGIRSWLIHTQLEFGGRPLEANLAQVRDEIHAVLGGPEYLRRRAAMVAARSGDWHLCNRIATVGIR